MTALRRSTPGLAQRLDCLAEAIQDAVRESRIFWTELAAVLAELCAARPARTRVLQTSQCLHRGKRKLLVNAWQTCACDPATRPACAGLVRGVVSRERRSYFSSVDELVGVATAGGGAQDPSAALRPASTESRKDFDNHAG